MAEYHINKGLEIPISGQPEQSISDAKTVDRVAIMAIDFVGMKPKMLCETGDKVRRGQALFMDKENDGLCIQHLEQEPLLRSIACKTRTQSVV